MTEVVEVHFTLEKDLQQLTEENMELIFGVEFVTSEFELQGLRIDSLCFDIETNSFVIIEYKRDSNFSVIDQGFAYLSLLLNNKAEFILKYNEVKNTFLKRNEIDWSQSRIIFVCRTFTTYQRKAMGFKDLPIELYEVKKFVNNLLLFNKIETQEKADSITRISQKNEIVRKVSSEIKVYSEQDHLKRANELTKSLYNELKTSIISISPEIQIKPKKLYIAFVHRTNFSDFVIRKERLDVFINLKKGSLNDPRKMAIDVSKSGHWGNGDYLLKISNASDLGYVLTLIRQSFDLN